MTQVILLIICTGEGMSLELYLTDTQWDIIQSTLPPEAELLLIGFRYMHKEPAPLYKGEQIQMMPVAILSQFNIVMGIEFGIYTWTNPLLTVQA
jgi:hypothetical protein